MFSIQNFIDKADEIFIEISVLPSNCEMCILKYYVIDNCVINEINLLYYLIYCYLKCDDVT